MACDYLDIGYFLALAEKLLGVPAEVLHKMQGLVPLAESALHAPRAAFAGQEQYPDFAAKAAVLCARLIKNHPLPDGNKRIGFLCMIEFIERNGFELTIDDEDEAEEILVGVAAGTVTEEELTIWVAARIR